MGGDLQCPGVRLYLGSLGLLTQMSLAEAQSFGLLDPKLCYLLDGLLFIYGVIITALFLRTKVSAEGWDLNTQAEPGPATCTLRVLGRGSASGPTEWSQGRKCTAVVWGEASHNGGNLWGD